MSTLAFSQNWSSHWHADNFNWEAKEEMARRGGGMVHWLPGGDDGCCETRAGDNDGAGAANGGDGAGAANGGGELQRRMAEAGRISRNSEGNEKRKCALDLTQTQ